MAFDKIFRGPPDNTICSSSPSSPNLGVDVVNDTLWLNCGNGWIQILTDLTALYALNKLFIDAEEPSGIIDGTNTVFVLGNVPNPPKCLNLYVNGLWMTQGEDYTLSDNVITMTEAPQTGYNLRASYRY